MKRKLKVGKIFNPPEDFNDKTATIDFPGLEGKSVNHIQLYRMVSMNLEKPTVMSRHIMGLMYAPEVIAGFTAKGKQRISIPEETYNAVYSMCLINNYLFSSAFTPK